VSSALARAASLTLVISLAAPASAVAHSLFADHNPDRPLREYPWIGFWHMVGGWDHLLVSTRLQDLGLPEDDAATA
jgi:hypothetical protein